MLRLLLAFLLLAALASPARADVTLPAVFTDGCVLQRGVPVRVWGRADPGERVTVRFGGHGRTATAAEDGRWRVELPALSPGKPRMLRVKGRNTIRLRNVVVGEVWICSGQSNMEWSVARSRAATSEIAAATHPDLRLFRAARRVAPTSGGDVKGAWRPCRPATVKHFSAVAYFFGREIQERTGVPVGLIETAWGGTPAEGWTPVAALEAEEELAPLLSTWTQRIENAGDDAKGRKIRQLPGRPGNLWRGMVEPLVPFTCRGVIWYQGESNAGRAAEYRTLFPTMIRAWREAWGAELPFYFVQLANFRAVKPEPGPSAWAELRDAQFHTLRTVPRTGMAVAIDIGEATDIHPKNKQDVGLRLAHWALRHDYGQDDVVPSGPLYTSMEVDGRRVRLHFEHAEGLKTAGGAKLEGFQIAGADECFVWARALIERDTVVVFHPEVKEPKAVRYAWADNPVATLANGAGLPASPFRTDTWRLTTER